jgi:hypothetical protein
LRPAQVQWLLYPSPSKLTRFSPFSYDFNLTAKAFSVQAQCHSEVENPDGWGFVSFGWTGCESSVLTANNEKRDTLADTPAGDTTQFKWDQYPNGNAVLWVVLNVTLNVHGGAQLSPDLTARAEPSRASLLYVLQTAVHTIPVSQFNKGQEYVGPKKVVVDVEEVVLCSGDEDDRHCRQIY